MRLCVLVARTGSVESVGIICRMDVVARVDRRLNSSTILAELSRARRAQRSTMGTKMWYTTHTDRPPARSSPTLAYQCKISGSLW